MAGPSVDVRTLGELAEMSESSLAAVVTGITTMFIPALSQAPMDEHALFVEGLGVYLGGEDINAFGYGTKEVHAVEGLAQYSTPDFYQKRQNDAQVAALMLDLALDTTFQYAFAADPDDFVTSYNITGQQMAAYVEDVPGIHMLKSYRGSLLMRPHVMACSM